MGNACCSDDNVSSTQILPLVASPKNNTKNQSQNQLNYIDSEGLPLPNAYKRYVKPPTTVGRQSVIVRNLHENDEVPDWMWALDKNILSSNHNNKNINQNYQNLQNRKTFQQIQGRFKGVQTINLSKLNAQPRNMTGSQNVNGFNSGVASNQNKIRYTVQPTTYQPFQQAIIQSQKTIISNQSNNQVFTPNIPIKKTLSTQQVPFITSVNASQNIMHNNPVNSNMVSVNNSIQQSPLRAIDVVRY